MGWKLIVEFEESYEIGGLNLFHPLAPPNFDTFQKAGTEVFLALARHAELFKAFTWFFDYPIMNTVQHDETTSITFGDLRFASTAPLLPEQARRNTPLRSDCRIK